jgi:hypothetical protein|nr:hypothetical protein [uncultured Oscillibacter sp.]DAZ27249.1 MAG TPA: hypothetical protein [Caudoviricetes sp.]
MNIGDKLDLRPTVFGNGAEIVNNGPQPCRVVWIHPLGRYFVVEFRSRVTGERFRETMYFQDRGGKIRRKEQL